MCECKFPRGFWICTVCGGRIDMRRHHEKDERTLEPRDMMDTFEGTDYYGSM